MFEPDKPITIYAKCTPFPAYELESDENKPLKPSWVILRHRHLIQQQRVIQGLPSSDNPGAKPTRGTSVSPAESGSSIATTTPAATTSTLAQGNLPSTRAIAVASEAVPAATARDTANPDASAPQGGASPSLPRHELPPHVVSTGPSAQVSGEEVISAGAGQHELHISRHEHAIRSRGEKTSWFSSTGHELLTGPPDLPQARFSDLYIHSVGGARQAWLRTSTSQWLSVGLSHPHPYLKGYILNICANGEPSWVTKDTMRTYKGRVKKREKAQEQEKASSPAR